LSYARRVKPHCSMSLPLVETAPPTRLSCTRHSKSGASYVADTTDECRAEYLRPAQLRARREKADVALLPVGTYEWHGPQNPVGLDSAKAHHLACEVAKRLDGGGVVFSPLHYGVPRSSFHMDIMSDDVMAKVAAAYGTTPETVAGFEPATPADIHRHWQLYQDIIRAALEQIAGFGFKCIYIVIGHYPLTHFIRPVAVTFSRATKMAGRPIVVDWGRENDGLSFGGDHGGKWETSLMMAADPDSVDLDELKRQPEYVGVGAGANAVESDLDTGRDWMGQCADNMAAEVRKLIQNYPQVPIRHSHSR